MIIFSGLTLSKSTRKFSILTSRWMMHYLWQYATAWSICLNNYFACPSLILREFYILDWIITFRKSFIIKSITIIIQLWSSNTSRMFIMFGWRRYRIVSISFLATYLAQPSIACFWNILKATSYWLYRSKAVRTRAWLPSAQNWASNTWYLLKNWRLLSCYLFGIGLLFWTEVTLAHSLFIMLWESRAF